jgi:hypothetical protein
MRCAVLLFSLPGMVQFGIFKGDLISLLIAPAHTIPPPHLAGNTPERRAVRADGQHEQLPVLLGGGHGHRKHVLFGAEEYCDTAQHAYLAETALREVTATLLCSALIRSSCLLLNLTIFPQFDVKIRVSAARPR